jgi:hypothetical protein
MGCGWWNRPTQHKEDCYWYREEQDMNAHIPYCTCKNQFPLNTCENCDDYHSRNRRTQGDRIRAMTDEELAMALPFQQCPPHEGKCTFSAMIANYCDQCWLDWLRQEAEE